MKYKIVLGLVSLFFGAWLLGGINVAFGVLLAALGVGSLIDAYTQQANSRYSLTAIEGTFRATAEGANRHKVARDLSRTIESWRADHP